MAEQQKSSGGGGYNWALGGDAVGQAFNAAGILVSGFGEASDMRANYRQGIRSAFEQARFVREEGYRRASSQRAAFGAAGVEQVGTPQAAQNQTVLAALQESNNIIFEAYKARDRQKKAAKRRQQETVIASSAAAAVSLGAAAAFFLI